jgi:hypothetical protein
MKTGLTTLSTKNLATLTLRVINASKSNKFQAVENHPLLLAVEDKYKLYDRVYSKLTFSGKGDEVAVADQRRDKPFTNIRGFLKGVAGMDSLPNQQAAIDVLAVFKTFGTEIDKLNYSEETAQMRKLIEALETETMQANLTALNILPAFAELKQAQADFEAIYAEQSEANAELRMMPSATVARKDLEKALRSYLNLLSAMQDLEEWAGIYAEINELLKAAKNS